MRMLAKSRDWVDCYNGFGIGIQKAIPNATNHISHNLTAVCD